MSRCSGGRYAPLSILCAAVGLVACQSQPRPRAPHRPAAHRPPTRRAAERLPPRHKIPKDLRWNLAHIYPSVDAWKRAAAALSARLPRISDGCVGQLTRSAAQLRRCLDRAHGIQMEASKIFFYARGTRDQDMRRSQGSGLLTRAVALHSRADSAIRAFEPERLAAPAFTMRTLAKSPLLKPHARYLRSLLRRRPHVLSAREEALLAKLRPALGSAPGIFQTLMGPELPFVEVTLADGRRQRLS